MMRSRRSVSSWIVCSSSRRACRSRDDSFSRRVLAAPATTANGDLKSWETELRNVFRDILGLGFQVFLVRLLGQHDPFHGHGGLIHEAFKKMDVFGIEALFGILGKNAHNPHNTGRGDHRQIEGLGAGERVGTQTGGVAIIEDPPGNAQLLLIDGKGARSRFRYGQFPLFDPIPG